MSDPDFKDLGVLKPLPVCEFETGGPEGIVESVQITKEGKASASEAVDCKWYIRAPPRSKIYLRFLDYEMQNSNECKRNFVAVYDGSSAVEDLKAKFCSTVANDVMLRTGLGVIRMWADEGSRNSRFQMLFTSFQEQKRKASLLDQLTNTSGTVIGVTSCIVIILIIVSVIVQIKQPRKKYVQRKSDFDQTVFQEVFEPPHYELCTLRGTGATADFADVADDFENYHKLRRSSSKCVHDHHCGSQLSSTKGSRGSLSTRDASVLTEMPPQPAKPLVPPVNRRNILVMKHNYSQDAADACDIDELEEVPTTSHRLSRHDKAVQRFSFYWWLKAQRLNFRPFFSFFRAVYALPVIPFLYTCTRGQVHFRAPRRRTSPGWPFPGSLLSYIILLNSMELRSSSVTPKALVIKYKQKY
ncbi:neuropilin- and tolloid-like protein 1 isoform 3 precursor [Camelus ferus]|nr:neuropilin- and tolloid-like protein 1 isoform 3 precursor [Camelus ferus]